MASMLRLGSRTSVTPPTSPRRCRVYGTKSLVHPTTPGLAATPAAPMNRSPSHWAPGDPIRFASDRAPSARPSVSSTSPKTTTNASGPDRAGADRGREWQPGQPIRFGSQPSKVRNAMPDREAGMSPVKKQSRLSEASVNAELGARRSPGTPASSLSWVPRTWAATKRPSSAPAPSPPPYSGSSDPSSIETIRATSSVGPSRISKAELDLLVDGIDFDDDFADFMETEVSPQPKPSAAPSTLPRRKVLTDDELEALVSGIDFSEDLETDEAPDAAAVPSPPRHCPSTALNNGAGLEKSSTAPSPSPRSETPDENDDSRTSSLLDLMNSPTAIRTGDESASLSPTPRSRSRSRSAVVEVIDLDSSYEDLDEPDQFTRSAVVATPATLDLADSSDGEVEIVSRGRRPAADPVGGKNDAPPLPSPAVPGFFARPEGLAPPGSASTSVATKIATNVKSSAVAATPREAARLKKTAKAGEDAQRQADFRRRWPRTFSYKKWHKDVRVVYTANEIVVERELRAMSGPLGFDLEWDSYSGYRTQGKTALAQVSDENTVLLVHVAKMKRFPPALQGLVEDPHRIKLGVQIAGDGNKLKRDFGFEPRGLLDLNACVHHYDPSRYHGRQRRGLIGLQEMTGIYLDHFLPKEHAVRTSRWSAVLGQEQKDYAANDVYATVQIVRQIQALADVPSERAETDLAALSRRAFSPWTGFGPSTGARPTAARSTKAAATTAAVTHDDKSTAPTSPDQILSPRRFQAFSLFHRQELSLADVTARMSETKTVKPVTVVWNLLSAFAALEEHRIDIAWDVDRLVAAMDDIGDWPERMVAEHGKLAAKLRTSS
ncbi:hypothetical protein BMF94_2308 [Rhodotorula taiwanensis]|uniref:3'-5' exonuclease domain-containing protein n=1 Tax=Rhodotorula taiwanensis TaxID=741276 RepID=A0A2S5BCQ2_9BASI|nr:hypothetical protein BMF94_2308 [Rhodotorula taiwanensis]